MLGGYVTVTLMQQAGMAVPGYALPVAFLAAAAAASCSSALCIAGSTGRAISTSAC